MGEKKLPAKPEAKPKRLFSSLEQVNVFALQKLPCGETCSFIPLVFGGNKLFRIKVWEATF